MEKYYELGSKLGYEGQELRHFVSERDKIDRDERHAVRQSEARKLDAERDEGERKICEVEMTLMHEQEMNRIQLESERMTSQSNNDPIAQHADNFVRPSPMQPFKESTMSIQTYLDIYERYATDAGWDVHSLAINLGRLLTGKAADVYVRLPISLAHNYQSLKSALLECYQLTSDDFRRKFFTSRLMDNESALQLMERMKHALSSWITVAKIELTFDGLFDLLLKTQYIRACPRDLTVFITQQAPEGLEKLVEISGHFLDSKPRYSGQLNDDTSSKKPNDTGRSQVSVTNRYSGSVDQNITRSPRNANITCFLCNKRGHVARDCRERSSRAPKPNQRSGPRTSQFANAVVADDAAMHNESCPRAHQANNTNPDDCRACVRDCTPDFCSACVRDCKNLPTFEGFVNETKVDVLRDSGCSVIVDKSALVSPSEFTGAYRQLILIDNSKLNVPTARCFVKSPFFTGLTEVICIEHPVCDLIIGNVDGVHPYEKTAQVMSKVEESQLTSDCTEVIDETMMCHATLVITEPVVVAQSVVVKPDEVTTVIPTFYKSVKITPDESQTGGAAVTRSQTRKPERTIKPLRVSSQVKINVTKDKFQETQINDKNLSIFVDKADVYFPEADRNPLTSWYEVEDELLYHLSNNPGQKEPVKQLMVPTELRSKVLALGHEAMFAGHLGVKKTLDRISASFYWPGILQSVQRFCSSCDICQRTVRKGSVSRAPLHSIPVVNVPFEKVAIDIIGPIVPKSGRGHRWILTLVDFATRYPEAVCLKSIETEMIAEALLTIFARMGIPKTIVSDNGPQFVSSLMNEIARLLSINFIHSTPYHPQANGLVERMNGTLKTMLRRMCAEKPLDWDRYVESLLFAYREAP